VPPAFIRKDCQHGRPVPSEKSVTQCPLWVITRPHAVLRPCPLYPRKRTKSRPLGMSALCQSRPNAPQQKRRYSITSSALAVAGSDHHSAPRGASRAWQPPAASGEKMTVTRLTAVVALICCFVAGYFLAGLWSSARYKSPCANQCPRRLREQLARESSRTACRRRSRSRVKGIGRTVPHGIEKSR
jgi:hypothetical protein